MKVAGVPYRTLWEKDTSTLQIIDQRQLPFKFVIVDISTPERACQAIEEMWVRGAGLIGAMAGYGMYLAALSLKDSPRFTDAFHQWAPLFLRTRPTAVNLRVAVEKTLKSIHQIKNNAQAIEAVLNCARQIANDDAQCCQAIGEHGAQLIKDLSRQKKNKTVNILTHCNAGWLAFVDFGSALSPVYKAFDEGVDVHVWVDETRPRNQGARLTAWELQQHGVPHTLISDNTGGHLMQHGQVDLVIVGADRVTRNGDVANKIGTYLKALAAHDNQVPFYVAFPSSTIDWTLTDGIKNIPIEERSGDEVKYMEGKEGGRVTSFLITTEESPALNYGFDVTPARLITGLITERGISQANESGLKGMFA